MAAALAAPSAAELAFISDPTASYSLFITEELKGHFAAAEPDGDALGTPIPRFLVPDMGNPAKIGHVMRLIIAAVSQPSGEACLSLLLEDALTDLQSFPDLELPALLQYTIGLRKRHALVKSKLLKALVNIFNPSFVPNFDGNVYLGCDPMLFQHFDRIFYFLQRGQFDMATDMRVHMLELPRYANTLYRIAFSPTRALLYALVFLVQEYPVVTAGDIRPLFTAWHSEYQAMIVFPFASNVQQLIFSYPCGIGDNVLPEVRSILARCNNPDEPLEKILHALVQPPRTTLARIVLECLHQMYNVWPTHPKITPYYAGMDEVKSVLLEVQALGEHVPLETDVKLFLVHADVRMPLTAARPRFRQIEYYMLALKALIYLPGPVYAGDIAALSKYRDAVWKRSGV